MQVEAKYLEWFTSGDTGISSKTLICLLLGINNQDYKSVPADLSDFGRCYRMISRFPELKQRFPEVAEANPEWRPFLDCWQQMSRLYNECVKWEALPEDEQKRQKKRKYFRVPNDEAWDVMQRLNDCSRYLSGLRPQGSLDSWRRPSTHLEDTYKKAA